MKPERRILAMGLRWGLSFAILGYVGYRAGQAYKALDASAITVSWPWLLVSLSGVVLFMLLMSITWGAVMRDLGASITTRAAFRMVCISNLAKYVPGGVWNMVGRVAMCSKVGVHAISTSTSLLIEAISQIAIGALLSLLVLSSIFSKDLLPHPGLLAISALLLAGAIHPRVINFGLGLIGRLLKKQWAVNIAPRAMLKALSWYAGSWLVLAVSFSILAHAVFHLGLGLRNVMFLCGAFGLAWNAGALAIFLPAGVGVRELVLIGVLTPYLHAEGATLFSVIARLWMLLGEVVAFALALLWRGERTALETSKR